MNKNTVYQIIFAFFLLTSDCHALWGMTGLKSWYHTLIGFYSNKEAPKKFDTSQLPRTTLPPRKLPPVALAEPTYLQRIWQWFGFAKKHLKTTQTPMYDTTKAPLGIKNSGNTCYINTAAQALLTPMVAMAITEENRNPNFEQDPLVKNYRELALAMIMSKHKESLNATELCATIRKSMGTEDNAQDDASECMLTIIDRLANLEVQKESSLDHAYKPKITKLFTTHYKVRSTCQQCHNTFGKLEKEKTIPLAITAPNFDECLGSYFAPEHRTGDNKVHCDVCQENTERSVTKRIKKAPQVLITTLKIFDYSMGSAKKNNSGVTFPLEFLDLAQYMTKKSKSLYALKSIAFHHGKELSRGHYTAYVNTENGWYHCDDTSVKPVEKNTIDQLQATGKPHKNQTPYVLVYEQVKDHVN